MCGRASLEGASSAAAVPRRRSSICVLCAMVPPGPHPHPLLHTLLELQKPPPVNSSINNLCLSVSLPDDCCLCACKIQLGCDGWGWGRGAVWAEEGFGRHYCLPGWHFICNESWAGGGPRPESTTTRLLLFSSLEKKSNLHVYFCIFYFFVWKPWDNSKLCCACIMKRKISNLQSSIFSTILQLDDFHPLPPLVVQLQSAAHAPRLDWGRDLERPWENSNPWQPK